MYLPNGISSRGISRVICVVCIFSLSFLVLSPTAWASSEQNAYFEGKETSEANAALEDNAPESQIDLQTIAAPMTAANSDNTKEHAIEEGFYTVSSAIDEYCVWDISVGSLSDGGNLQLWNANGTNAQKFVLSKKVRIDDRPWHRPLRNKRMHT